MTVMIGIIACTLFLLWFVPLVFINGRLNHIEDKLDQMEEQ